MSKQPSIRKVYTWSWRTWLKQMKDCTHAWLSVFTWVLHTEVLMWPWKNTKKVSKEVSSLKLRKKRKLNRNTIKYQLPILYLILFIESTSVNSVTSTSWLTNITETHPPNINNTTSEKKITSTLTPTYSCFQFDENLQQGDLLSPHPKCHTKRACATLLNDQNGFTKFFCDEGNLCDKYNFNISKCHQVKWMLLLSW